MNRIKRVANHIKTFLSVKPWALILVVALGFMLLMVVFEYTRAKIYLSSANGYKNSVKVLRVKDLAEKVAKEAQTESPAAYCDVSHRDLIGEFNEAYDKSPDNSELEVLIFDLRESINLAGSPPAFNSPFQFVPKVLEARKISQEMHKSVAKLLSLTNPDVRAEYCSELVEVLSDVYFLSSIETAEGVGALFVGQVENFQVNVKQALDRWAMIDPPTVFYDIHLEIGKVLNSIAVNLRNDTNDNEAFSRAIETDVENLDALLTEIKDGAEDLQARPGQISLQANFLE